MKAESADFSSENGYLVYFVEDLQRSFETINSFVNNDIWYFHLQLSSVASRHHCFVLNVAFSFDKLNIF